MMAPGSRRGSSRHAVELAGLLLFLSLASRPCSAMFLTGTADLPGNSTIFIGKYCFTFDRRHEGSAGKLNVTVWAPNLAPHQSVHVVMFDDEAESFPGPSGQWDALSCDERIQHAKHTSKLDWTRREEGQLIRFNVKEHLRPRFWYIALADCSGSGLDSISFEVHAINVPYGWAAELPTDKRLVPHALVIFVAAYGALFVAQLHAKSLLLSSKRGDSARDKAAHPFAQILTAGILLGLVSAVLSMLHFLWLAADGEGLALARVCGQLLSGASRFVLACLLLLVSEGKCISYVMVAADGRRVARMLGPFLIACLLLELWGDYSLSRRYTTGFVYTTSFGWAIIFVDLLLLAVYAANLQGTYEVERDTSDGMFYRRWGIFYGSWFLALPITTILSQAALAPYVWYIVSMCVLGAVDIVVYAALVVGLWPGNTKTYFKLTPACPWPDDSLETADFEPPPRLPSLLGNQAHSKRCAKLGYTELP